MEFKTIIEPFKIKSVEPIYMSTEAERIEYLKKANYNTFLLESNQVIIDLLTDSGTSAMSSKQWAGIMEGDEAYAGSSSWSKMENTIKSLTGYRHVLPTHQGRAAERIVYGLLGGSDKTFISNTHFDTTRANIEFSGAEAIDIPIKEARIPSAKHPFKGNMDIEKLRSIIAERGKDNIAAVILTVTNNSGGGQPASMENAQQISKICRKHNIPFLLDCCRIAENSYFIKLREKNYQSYTYKDIAHEMFSLADGALMSAKKDGLVNMGGFIALQDDQLAESCKNMLIITEGYSTYGGLSGRDMEAIAIGLEEVFDPNYLSYRINSTHFLGERLHDMGVPLVYPIGGHAVYIDARAFYPHIPVENYPGQALVCELYKKGGVRAVEIGSVMFGKYNEQHQLVPAAMELVRLAIPRRVYTQSHMEYVIEVFEKLLRDRNGVQGYKIIEEPEYLRHFTCKFDQVEASSNEVLTT